MNGGRIFVPVPPGMEKQEHVMRSLFDDCCEGRQTSQNVKAVFDTAIKVVLQPPRRKEMARKTRHRRSGGCSFVSIVRGGCAA
ncbi:hypothetical protein K1719_000408 [Acacia pycnantha]|nr:hypothetical protein K1719_000408 [Acacia pycnantha]